VAHRLTTVEPTTTVSAPRRFVSAAAAAPTARRCAVALREYLASPPATFVGPANITAVAAGSSKAAAAAAAAAAARVTRASPSAVVVGAAATEAAAAAATFVATAFCEIDPDWPRIKLLTGELESSFEVRHSHKLSVAKAFDPISVGVPWNPDRRALDLCFGEEIDDRILRHFVWQVSDVGRVRRRSDRRAKVYSSSTTDRQT
jgi:hypothetical protein